MPLSEKGMVFIFHMDAPVPFIATREAPDSNCNIVLAHWVASSQEKEKEGGVNMTNIDQI